MVKIIFKNMESSQLARGELEDRVLYLIKKYPQLKSHQITLTVEMENSPLQAGPDLFSVSSIISGPSIKRLKMKKSSHNFYLAVAGLIDSLKLLISDELDRLNKSTKRLSYSTKKEFYE